jgi:hypothetical protein
MIAPRTVGIRHRSVRSFGPSPGNREVDIKRGRQAHGSFYDCPSDGGNEPPGADSSTRNLHGGTMNPKTIIKVAVVVYKVGKAAKKIHDKCDG